ncbi:MAG: hypothetical protein KF868_19850 [Acidobacteria bacterium]|nr:hypothetical protein [Acidobacteriota bacterium]
MNDTTMHAEELGFRHFLKEASDFFMTGGDVEKTLRRLAERLESEGVAYAVVGAMALGRHGLRRMTEDVDVLLTRDGLERFRQRCVGLGYTPAFNGARKAFRDAETHVRIEFLTTGEYPGDGKPKPVAFPDPIDASTEVAGIRVVTLPVFVEIKLASGMTAPHRLRDLSDVQDLIAIRRLPPEFADELDPSVRAKYLELWRSVQDAAETQPSQTPLSDDE